MIAALSSLKLSSGSTLIVVDKKNEALQKSASNLPNVKTLMAHYLNVIDLLRFDNVLIASPAIEVIDSYLSAAANGVATTEEAA